MSNTQLAGMPLPFEWGGKTYYLGSRNYQLDLAFQQYQEGHARRRLAAHRKEMGEEDYAEQMRGWRHDCGSNVYAFGQEMSWRFLWSSPQGLREYIWLKIKKGEVDHPDAEPFSRDDLEAIANDEDAWEDLRLLVTEMDFPKSLLPEGLARAAALRQRRKIGSVPPVTSAEAVA